MIQNVLQEIGGIGLYGVISLCLFFGVFSAVMLWALRLKQPFVRSMESKPLDEAFPAPGGDAVQPAPGRARPTHSTTL